MSEYIRLADANELWDVFTVKGVSQPPFDLQGYNVVFVCNFSHRRRA